MLFGVTAARDEEPRLPRKFLGLGGTAGRSIGGVEEAELLSPAALDNGEPTGGDCEAGCAGEAGTPVGGECWCGCRVGDCSGGGGEAALVVASAGGGALYAAGGAAGVAGAAGGAEGAAMRPELDERSA